MITCGVVEHNVGATCVGGHPFLPLYLSGGSDGSIMAWQYGEEQPLVEYFSDSSAVRDLRPLYRHNNSETTDARVLFVCGDGSVDSTRLLTGWYLLGLRWYLSYGAPLGRSLPNHAARSSVAFRCCRGGPTAGALQPLPPPRA